jgi:hypothetical protein
VCSNPVRSIHGVRPNATFRVHEQCNHTHTRCVCERTFMKVRVCWALTVVKSDSLGSSSKADVVKVASQP